MKICAVQTRPVKGDIPANIENHIKLMELPLANGASMIIFPELSLTGYEPRLAKELATTPDDSRLDDFQTISDGKQVIIGVGIPTKNKEGICISMVLFQPQKPRLTYSKKYLHADEEPFFVSGQNFATFKSCKTNIAPAICYELSIPGHSENAFKNGAEVYVASVAKTARGVVLASKSLSDIARKYSMTVLMANCVGPSDDFKSAGKTSIWNSKGVLVVQLDDTNEGIAIIDTGTEEVLGKSL